MWYQCLSELVENFDSRNPFKECNYKSISENKAVEEPINNKYRSILSNSRSECYQPQLYSETHAIFLEKSLKQLDRKYQYLDASQPWLCYWITHSLDIIGRLTKNILEEVVKFILTCQSNNGGFGGGYLQSPHLAPTYASICILTIASSYGIEAFERVDLVKLKSFLYSCRNDDGSFCMQPNNGGETDSRGIYCASTVAFLTGLNEESLFKNSINWIISCLSYEGGFGAMPGCEAHGSYTYCCLAALLILDGSDKLTRYQRLNIMSWLNKRQSPYSGGIQGRTNKLVDGCYSFWQGASVKLMELLINETLSDLSSIQSIQQWEIINKKALQLYLLLNCQNTLNGGLLDKPGKSADLYHTCYCLSGLSLLNEKYSSDLIINLSMDNESTVLKTIHPLFNISKDAFDCRILK